MSILELATQYYERGIPFLTDAEFDYLEERIGNLKVGCKSGDIKHPHRLYSLNKFYDESKAPIFKHSIKTPKLDGQAIDLVYESGKLVLAITRGDGFQGRDVTEFLSHKVPTNLSNSGSIQVIGELVAPKSIDNARNYAAGATNLKSLDEFLQREVYFVAYEIRINGSNIYNTYTEDLAQLKSEGFTTVLDISQLPELPTDGFVVRTNNNLEFFVLGFTAKYPRGAYALKDANAVPIEETTLLDVIWQVGGSGKVTPVAIFEEVDIEGAKVSRATLHNTRFIEELGLDIGDTILVTRRGGIIPAVIGKV